MNVRKEIIRFSTAGIVVGTTHFGSYYFLIHFLSFSLSAGISFVCAGIIAYLFNKYWTFKHDQPSASFEIGRYLIINFLALVINIIVNQGVLNLWPDAVFLALIAASIITGLLTFICLKWWVFKTQWTVIKG